jgi:alpha-L-fucosidase
VAANGQSEATLTIDLGDPATFNVIMIQEMITQGQRVEEFRIEAWDGTGWRVIGVGTTVGHKRLLRGPDTKTNKVRLVITKSRGEPTVREFGLYLAPPLPEK